MNESTREVQIKYPAIMQVLRRLYRVAYSYGSGCGAGEEKDGYDHATAYDEIESIVDELLKELIFNYECEL